MVEKHCRNTVVGIKLYFFLLLFLHHIPFVAGRIDGGLLMVNLRLLVAQVFKKNVIVHL